MEARQAQSHFIRNPAMYQLMPIRIHFSYFLLKKKYPYNPDSGFSLAIYLKIALLSKRGPFYVSSAGIFPRGFLAKYSASLPYIGVGINFKSTCAS